MRYLRKFKGDQITEDDLMPSSIQALDIEIPNLEEKKTSHKDKLNSLPMRFKTRFGAGRNSGGRRVVSTPIFDLVIPEDNLDLLPPPHLQDSSTLSVPKCRNTSFTGQQARKSLPPLPSKARQVSMPTNIERAARSHGQSLSSYTSIIDIYQKNSPFGSVEHSIETKSVSKSSTSDADASSSSDDASSLFSYTDEDEILTRASHSPNSSITTTSTSPTHNRAKFTPVSMTYPQSDSYVTNIPRQTPPTRYQDTFPHTPASLHRLSLPRRKPPPKSLTHSEITQDLATMQPSANLPFSMESTPAYYSTQPRSVSTPNSGSGRVYVV
ncbi:CYFA0S14e01772g1_1 [Cyberlindnera fabianii]|uniref:CYFA0S14e01772g1_1 n=1 Tax=Cyberlindnera fabianii TaxID=36022 RepID=A0A061BBH8_CYBFA|nr:hypothetical protein BON22_3952 [Cyberlindnera fabianii]CDR44294.1 CYFA0S14e01772g1_1 [Cyberlindnera fabianii]